MKILARLVATALLIAPVAAFALDLRLSANARQLTNRISPVDSYALPVGPFDAADGVPVQVFEGRIERQSWRLSATSKATLRVFGSLRDQFVAQGYDIVFDCRDLACGGFDFRFATEVIPAPDMHVNIRDFRFLGAVRGEGDALGLLVSQAGPDTYVQLIHAIAKDHAGPTVPAPQIPDVITDKVDPADTPGLAGALLADGRVILADLVFDPGAARLGKGPFDSLAGLTAILKDNAEFRIALVGHTDNVGSLADNIALSKLRAESVRTRLLAKYGIAPGRIEAEGMGFLAPVASNLTLQGRTTNRRVEAVLLAK